MDKHWYQNCPRCNQGRLFIMRRDREAKLYLHCEECEWTWENPDEISDTSKGRLGIDFDSDYVPHEDIVAANWDKFALHRDE